MSHSLIVNSESFNSSISSFKDTTLKIKEILDSITELMKEIDGDNETWKSKTAVSVHEKYKETELRFKDINETFEKYNKFLITTLEDYQKEEKKQEVSIDSQSDNLDVNE